MAFLQTTSAVVLRQAQTALRTSQWNRRTKMHATVAFCLALTLMLMSLCIYFLMQDLRNNTTELTTCDLQNASEVEKSFSINIRFGSQLSYIQVRAISIAWDLVVGQGGRFLQAWILYKVTCDALSFLMERYRVPYEVYASSTLSPGSLENLYSLVKLLGRRRKPGVYLTAIWLLLSFVHVLGFPTLWSAATGYVNPTAWKFGMPDGVLVDLKSDRLAYCYTCVDCGKIGLGNNMTLLSDSFSKLRPTEYPAYQEPFISMPSVRAMEYALQSVYDDDLYKRDKGDLAQVFNYTRNAERLLEAAYETTNTNISQPITFPTGFNESWIPALQTAATTDAITSNPEELLWVFDGSVARDPETIPYNSTIVINDKTYLIPAPLLKFMNPTAVNAIDYLSLGVGGPSSLGMSSSSSATTTCYNGQILPTGWTDNPSCVSDAGFVWGFSSLLVLLGLSLQLVWILALYFVWLNANLRSSVCKSGRKLDGVYRNATDLVGAMRDDFGNKIDFYSDKEFKQALAKCGDIGWVMRGGDSNGASYVLSSSLESKERASLIRRNQLAWSATFEQ